MNRENWLAQMEQSVRAKVGEDGWSEDTWSEFVKDAVWLLHHDMEITQDDQIEAAAVGLIKNSIKTEADLKSAAGVPPKETTFREALKPEGVPRYICDNLFTQYIGLEKAAITEGSFFTKLSDVWTIGGKTYEESHWVALHRTYTDDQNPIKVSVRRKTGRGNQSGTSIDPYSATIDKINSDDVEPAEAASTRSESDGSTNAKIADLANRYFGRRSF